MDIQARVVGAGGSGPLAPTRPTSPAGAQARRNNGWQDDRGDLRLAASRWRSRAIRRQSQSTGNRPTRLWPAMAGAQSGPWNRTLGQDTQPCSSTLEPSKRCALNRAEQSGRSGRDPLIPGFQAQASARRRLLPFLCLQPVRAVMSTLRDLSSERQSLPGPVSYLIESGPVLLKLVQSAGLSHRMWFGDRLVSMKVVCFCATIHWRRQCETALRQPSRVNAPWLSVSRLIQTLENVLALQGPAHFRGRAGVGGVGQRHPNHPGEFLQPARSLWGATTRAECLTWASTLRARLKTDSAAGET